MHRKLYWAVAILVVALNVSGIAAVAQTPPDAVSNVPALEKFHDVIFKIWHEAWPKKDTALLQKLLPDVEKGISEVASAPLPGILREKKTAWEDGVKKLQSAGSDYKTAATAKDDAKLLTAAEELHSRFEGLARAIRPAMKELDDFHASLYMLYHHYLPKRDMTKIFSSAEELAQKMAALNAARLPERLKQKEPEFQAARAKLSSSVDDLQKIKTISSTQTIQNKVETVHSNYQALDRIFE